jgi:hypothetical protein
MKVLQVGKYAVYVYREVGGSHHLPHCHVRWPDGSIVVALPSLDVIAGGHLPREAREISGGSFGRNMGGLESTESVIKF